MFDIPANLRSRSISFENPTGAPGTGGRAASPLGAGRKGSAVRLVQPGESIELADIEGPGTIRHIWLTTHSKQELLRGCLLRVWWDDQPHPSIEAPLGDFFGFAHGGTTAFQSCAHSVGAALGMNSCAAHAVRASGPLRAGERGLGAPAVVLPDRLHDRRRARG